MQKLVDICMRKKALTVNFELNIDKWNTMDTAIKAIISGEWKCIKFLNENGDAINDEIKTVPNDSGGIYVFLIRPEIIPKIHLYIMYIGRAKKGNDYSLRKRCQEYIRDTRPNIVYMREIWGKYLYLYYLPLEGDDLIEKIERELISVILPPCNTQIPDKYISLSSAEAAF